MGAAVERTAPDTIEVEGRKRLRGAEHRVVPDRIEAGTFIVAAAVTGGKITLDGAPCDHLGAFLETVEQVGVGVDLRHGHHRGRRLRARAARGYRACDIETAPYPGPRDRPPAADLRAADPGRGRRRASTRRSSRTASSGWPRPAGWASSSTRPTPSTRPSPAARALHGAEVEIGDLRAGASLILAALAAEGTSTIHGAHHVQRGYENIERKFLDLGARIERVAEGTTATTS